MSIDPIPQITPALKITPMSMALEFSIANAVKSREDSALFAPVSPVEDAVDIRQGAVLDKRS